jgi:hypothetical protein
VAGLQRGAFEGIVLTVAFGAFGPAIGARRGQAPERTTGYR